MTTSIAEKLSAAFSVDVREIVSLRVLDGSHPEDEGRCNRYWTHYASAKDAAPPSRSQKALVALIARWSDDSVIEYLSIVDGDKITEDLAAAVASAEFVIGRCDITYEDLSPTQCIEFAFADESTGATGTSPVWHLSKTSNDGYEHFLQCKFKVWEKSMREPSCEAAFRRMLQRGLVYQMYDSNMFPTPEHLLPKYRVTDEGNGKVVELPHPVAHCRVWNASTQSYDILSTTLDGAPRDEAEAKTYWAAFLDELRTLRGKDYIDALLSGKEPTVDPTSATPAH